MVKGPIRKLRRFQGGGDIPNITPGPNAQIYTPHNESMGSQVSKGIELGLKAGQAYRDMQSQPTKGDPAGVQGKYQGAMTGDVSGGTGSPTAGGGSRKGGPIRKTYGPRIGREDGIIAAQKGEYVVRKSAVKKLGKKVLDTVNKGKLPERRMGKR